MDRSRILEGYLAALGLQAEQPGVPFLAALTSAHVARFAFSSVGPMLGEALPLDLDALYTRIVLRGRGGYCFEQNGLMFEVLQELGFDAELYLARVIHDRDVHPGLTHRITLVTLAEERYLVDVGFGPQGSRLPLNVNGAVVSDAGRSYRVFARQPGELHVQTLMADHWYSLYRFELARYGQADCELGHFYSHRHPQARFVNNLVASRILPDEVRSLNNRDYRIIRPQGEVARDVLDAGHLHDLLNDEFALNVSRQECRTLFAALP
jgi:N-hydroxyarylamine O-acetyltransferase